MIIIKKLRYYLRNYRMECFLAPFFKMVEAIFELLVPLVIANIIDIGIAERDSQYIIRRIIILFLFAFIGLISAITAQYFSAKAATGLAKEVKKELYEHIQSLSFSEIDEIGTSSFITRMSSDINQVQTGVNMFLRLFLRSPFVVFGALIMSFYVNPKTAIIFTIVIPVLFIVVFSIILVTIPLFKKVQGNLDKLLNRSRENIKGIRVIRAFNQNDIQQQKFNQENNTYVKAQVFASRISALMNPLTYLLINIAIVFIIYIGTNEIGNNKMAQGELVAQYNYMSQILVELIKLANLVITLTKALACWKRINSLFNYQNSQTFPEKTTITNKNDYAVEFENVSMRYKNNKEKSLENISFKIPKGSSLGIIGATGSGKTSIANLIGRYYDNESGKIYINGNPISNYSKKDLRKIVGTVRQKAILFRGTIRENLKISNQNATDTDLKEAIKIAQAEPVITAKKEGYDAIINQGGKNLSGGEAQRLNIARTLVGKPEILILDDSSSALDYLTDSKLRKSIREISYKPTLIIISQRSSAVMDCDLIIVLDEGKIQSMGNYQFLLDNSKIYQEIYYSQFPKESE